MKNDIIKLVITLLEKALELLKMFEKNGYEAYIVGGFVRDHILDIKSNDVDICTNATPMEMKKIFKNVNLPFKGYGSVSLTYKKVDFEITTYRMELEYNNKRAPYKILYTNNLLIDLKRRDFSINTLCMNSKGEIIDLLNSKHDIENKIIRMVGDPYKKTCDDPLRILRAVRFATILNFDIEKSLCDAIVNNGHLLNKLSYFRKKEELNKIFSSVNALRGIELLNRFGLDKYLDINLDKKIVNTSDPLGIWLQVSPSSKYQFTNNEKEYMNAILTILKDKKINDMEIYLNGSYVCYIAAQILNINEKDVYDRFDSLPIKNKNEIDIKPIEIINLLKKDKIFMIKKITMDLEEKIINRDLENKKEVLKKYIIETYKDIMI